MPREQKRDNYNRLKTSEGVYIYTDTRPWIFVDIFGR